MNIAVHASHLCQEREDGNQTYIKQLFRSIREETSEHAFWFYYNKPECKRIEASNFYHIHEEAPLAWTQRVFPSLLRRDAPDILFMPIQMMPIRMPRHLPSVVTIHDLAFLYYPRTFPLKDRVLHRLYVRWSVTHATHLIAISQATKDDIIKHYNVPEERISVVYHGIDRERFRLPQDSDNQRITQVQTKYGITKPYLLYIGNVQPRKNITNLVRAFHHMKEAGYTDMQLVIAGAQAWRVQDIFDSLGEYGTHEDLIFTGRFEDEDLPPLLWGSRGFILPSFYEGFGLPILEAFACGVPAIVADTPSLTEVAGEAGLICDPHDPHSIKTEMERLWNDADLRHQLSTQALERANMFSWNRCAQETLEVLTRIYEQST